MADLFGRADQILSGGLSSDSMFMTWPGLPGYGLGLLITQVGLNYRQPIRRIFELGPGVIPTGTTPINGAQCDGVVGPPPPTCVNRTQPTYYIIGRPEGRLQLSRIIGPGALQCAFYSTYGSACSNNIVGFTGTAGCSATDGSAQRMFWQLHGVVLDGVDMNATSQEMIMQEGIGAMFSGLKLSVNGLTCPNNVVAEAPNVNNLLGGLTGGLGLGGLGLGGGAAGAGGAGGGTGGGIDLLGAGDGFDTDGNPIGLNPLGLPVP